MKDNIISEKRDWLPDGTPYVIQDKGIDPLALRISIGGRLDKKIGIYVVYRGNKKEVIECLEKALEALKK